jgi:hypothetical protein
VAGRALRAWAAVGLCESRPAQIEAAGNSVKASNNASAIFFIMNHILLGLSFGDFLRVRVRSGLLDDFNIVRRKELRFNANRTRITFTPPGFRMDVPNCSPIMMDE